MSIDTSILKTWIRENPEKALSAKVVAVRFKVSVHTLYKEFIRKEGMSIDRFIDDARLEAVKQLLLRTDKKVFEIAHEFTFGREDVLTRWFKARTGMTMREFREKNGWQQSVGGGGKPKRI